MVNLYKHIFQALLHLACDPEQVARQLFQPLVFQLIHWFTGENYIFACYGHSMQHVQWWGNSSACRWLLMAIWESRLPNYGSQPKNKSPCFYGGPWTQVMETKIYWSVKNLSFWNVWVVTKLWKSQHEDHQIRKLWSMVIESKKGCV